MGTRKTATMMDVARGAGVSVATVARVIHNNGYVAQEKRMHILGVMQRLGYVGMVKQTPQEKSAMIGVVTPHDVENPFFAYLPHALAKAANEHCLYVALRVQQPCGKDLETIIGDFLRERVCGIIVIGFTDTSLSDETKGVLTTCSVPIVFVERTAPCYGINRVLVDGGAGVYLATKHLLELGHQELVYLCQTPNNDVDEQRLQGYRSAMAEVGATAPHVVGGTLGHIQDGYEVMQRAMRLFPASTGIVCWSDQYAVGAMRYCVENNLRVPEDLAITGFDCIYAQAMTPRLTSVEMPIQEMAQAAVSMVVENQQGTGLHAKTITLSPRLVVGQSTVK